MDYPSHLYNIHTRTTLGMDLERAVTSGSQLQRMGENLIRSRQQFPAHLIMGPAAFESNRLSFPHVGCSTVKHGFHHRSCFCKRHPFGQPADLRGVDSKNRKDGESGFLDQLRNPESFVKYPCIIRSCLREHTERPGRLGYKEEVRPAGP